MEKKEYIVMNGDVFSKECVEDLFKQLKEKQVFIVEGGQRFWKSRRIEMLTYQIRLVRLAGYSVAFAQLIEKESKNYINKPSWAIKKKK